MNDSRDTDPIHWRRPESWTGPDAPGEAWRAWLLDAGSLTERLRARHGDRLTLRLNHREYEASRPDETAALALEPAERPLVRRVVLEVDGIPVVHARAVIPPRTLAGDGQRLATLDERPLGEVAFAELDARRTDLEIARLPACSALFPEIGEPTWARRSILDSRAGPVLVTEAFMNTVLSIK